MWPARDLRTCRQGVAASAARPMGTPTSDEPGQDRTVSGAPGVEDAVATGPHEAGGDQQHDPQDDLTLDQLHDPHDHEDRCDDPQHGRRHGMSPSTMSGHAFPPRPLANRIRWSAAGAY